MTWPRGLGCGPHPGGSPGVVSLESGVLGALRGATWLLPPAQPRTLPPGCFPSPAATRLSRNAPLGVGLGPGWGGGAQGGEPSRLPPCSHPAPAPGPAGWGHECWGATQHGGGLRPDYAHHTRPTRGGGGGGEPPPVSVCLSVCVGRPRALGIPRATVPGAAPRAQPGAGCRQSQGCQRVLTRGTLLGAGEPRLSGAEPWL